MTASKTTTHPKSAYPSSQTQRIPAPSLSEPSQLPTPCPSMSDQNSWSCFLGFLSSKGCHHTPSGFQLLTPPSLSQSNLSKLPSKLPLTYHLNPHHYNLSPPLPLRSLPPLTWTTRASDCLYVSLSSFSQSTLYHC